MRPFRSGVAFVLALGVLAAAPAHACDPSLLPKYLAEIEGQLELAGRSDSMQEAQIHLRRVARNLAESELQLAGCDCLSATAGMGEAAATARRASQTSDPDEMVNAMEELLVVFDSAVQLLEEEICR